MKIQCSSRFSLINGTGFSSFIHNSVISCIVVKKSNPLSLSDVIIINCYHQLYLLSTVINCNPIQIFSSHHQNASLVVQLCSMLQQPFVKRWGWKEAEEV